MKYLLTISLPIKAIDDRDARSLAMDTLGELNPPDDALINLQRVEEGKAPVEVGWCSNEDDSH